MKILITTDWYTPVINGVVASVLNLQRELCALGHDVKILTLSRTHHSFCKDNVTYIGSIGAERVYPQARLRTAFASRYVQDLISWKPDIIHSQCEFSTFFLAQRIGSKLRIPVVHTYHTVYEDYTHYLFPHTKRLGKAVVGVLSKQALNKTAYVIAPTEKVENLLIKYGVTKRIQIIPSGIDLRKFTATHPKSEILKLKEELGIAPDRFVLLYVGRIGKEKNLDEIISFMRELNLPNLTLLVVGDGPYRATLEENCADLVSNHAVVFAGMIPPDKVPIYYHLGDVFVSASTSETQGLTYMEALASGLPAICKEDACLEQVIINGRTGWQYETFEEFEQYLMALIENQGLRTRIGKQAKEYICGRYSAESFAKNVEEIYISALKLKRP